jgi:hypothetical protein
MLTHLEYDHHQWQSLGTGVEKPCEESNPERKEAISGLSER